MTPRLFLSKKKKSHREQTDDGRKFGIDGARFI